MRILHIDIDSLRPDHLGCYGYHRPTSPHIDALASQGVRFENCYVSDAPCLPSRTALWSGRFGYHSGVVSHGGATAQPFGAGAARGFQDDLARTSWMSALRGAGHTTTTISSFGERHAAWHWYAGFSEIINPGRGGHDRADEVIPLALAWLERQGRGQNWFLHVNLWDPHTPYRTPAAFGNPFDGQPLPAWLTEEVRRAGWEGYGPMSAQEPNGYPGHDYARTVSQRYPRVPAQLDAMAAVRQWLDGYDTGIRFADEHIGRLVGWLDDAGLLDETAIIVSADHGENQGELNVWGDHQTADTATSRVPLIVRWPGLTDQPRLDDALHYQFDWAATLIELLGGVVPANWDGRSFAGAFQAHEARGRDFLVLGQGAWSCQRSVRFDHEGEAFLFIRTYHDGHKDLPPRLLFNLTADPHEQHDLAEQQPELVDLARQLLGEWGVEMAESAAGSVDPLSIVMHEGGPFHTRGQLPAYLAHLRATGRAHHADALAERHPDETAAASTGG